MKKLFFLRYALILLSFFMFMSGCTNSTVQDVKYDYDSWRTIIQDSCESFFDGCNNCRRSPGADVAACTRKMCPEYEKPVCLDKSE